MPEQIRSVPRPLVRTFQWVLVTSVILTWIFQFEWFLLIPLISGLSGLLFGYNPVMQFAKRFLKKPKDRYIPEEWEQLQFNQKMAVFCLGGGFFSFLLGWTIVGYVLTALVAIAAFVAILGFCIGCFILYQWKQFNYRRSM